MYYVKICLHHKLRYILGTGACVLLKMTFSKANKKKKIRFLWKETGMLLLHLTFIVDANALLHGKLSENMECWQ